MVSYAGGIGAVVLLLAILVLKGEWFKRWEHWTATGSRLKGCNACCSCLIAESAECGWLQFRESPCWTAKRDNSLKWPWHWVRVGRWSVRKRVPAMDYGIVQGLRGFRPR